MGLRGDPATSDWEEFLKEYSPYHNLSDDKTYPPALFVTSTKDTSACISSVALKPDVSD